MTTPIPKWTKYLIWILIIIVLILFFTIKCGKETDKDITAVKSDKRELHEFQVQANKEKEVLQKQNDSLRKDSELQKEKIAVLQQTSKKHLAKIQNIKAESKKKQSAVKHYTNAEFADYYKGRYPEFVSAVTETPNGLEFGQSILVPMTIDLVKGDQAQQVVIEQDGIITAQDSALKAKDSEIANGLQEIHNNGVQMKLDARTIDMSNNVIQKQGKIIKKQMRNAAMLKIGVPAGIAAGILTGLMIAN